MSNGTCTNPICRSGAARRTRLPEERHLREVLLAGRHLLLACADYPGEHVVVEVLAHARQLGLNLDPVRAQVLRRPDSRDHQQVGRLDRARGDDHLARCAHNLPLAVLMYSTPTHFPFSRISLVARECWLTVRFSRYDAGSR
jgi:hypothetical protein